MKLATDTPWIFQNYEYSEIMEIKNTKKFKSLGLYLVMSEFFKDYGIFLSGKTWLRDMNNKEIESEEVYCMHIKLEEFPLENEVIIQQCYGWKDRMVYIGVYSEHSCGGFVYDLNTYRCLFDEKWFDSLSDLFAALKETKTGIINEKYSLTV